MFSTRKSSRTSGDASLPVSGVIYNRSEAIPTPSNYEYQLRHARHLMRTMTKKQLAAYWQRRQLRSELGIRRKKMKITLPRLGGQ